MKSKKLLGIWLDHSKAHITDLTNGMLITKSVDSKPQLQVNEADLYFKDDSHTLNKEQQQLSSFYKKLSDVILDYDEVILFGPTDAKKELYNSVKDNHLFDKVKIGIQPADKMNESQQHTFIKDYFKPGQK